MANINLSTSSKSDNLIDVELKYLKTQGHKISKVDLVNFILEEIYNKEDLSQLFRTSIVQRLENMKIEQEERLKKIIRGDKK